MRFQCPHTELASCGSHTGGRVDADKGFSLSARMQAALIERRSGPLEGHKKPRIGQLGVPPHTVIVNFDPDGPREKPLSKLIRPPCAMYAVCLS